jgi:hypothetical protein
MTLLSPAEEVGAPNRDDIVRVVQLYIDGFNDCDADNDAIDDGPGTDRQVV